MEEEGKGLKHGATAGVAAEQGVRGVEIAEGGDGGVEGGSGEGGEMAVDVGGYLWTGEVGEQRDHFVFGGCATSGFVGGVFSLGFLVRFVSTFFRVWNIGTRGRFLLLVSLTGRWRRNLGRWHVGWPGCLGRALAFLEFASLGFA